MSILLKRAEIKITQPDGTKSSLDVVVDETRANAVTQINALRDQSILAMENKKNSVLSQIPDDYTTIESNIDQINEDLGKLKGTIVDGAKIENLVRDEFVSRGDGTFKSYGGWKRSDYIAIRKRVLLINASGDSSYNCAYDDSKKFLYPLAFNKGTNVIYLTNDVSYVVLSGEASIMEALTIDIENASTILLDNANDIRLDRYTNPNNYINKETGDIEHCVDWQVTNLINVINYNQLVFDGTTNTEHNAFYDENGKFIKSFSIHNGRSIVEKPYNAKWIRCSFYISCDTVLKNHIYCNTNAEKPLLPMYYDYFMESKNIRLMEYLDTISNCISFIYLTDLHLTENSKNSAGMITDILSNTNVNTVICGGDIIGSYGNNDTIDTTVKQYSDMYSKFDIYFTRGNHDCYNIAYEGSSNGVLKNNTYVYNRFFRKLEDKVNIQPNKTYYYFDKPQKKVRFIVIDTNEIMERNNSAVFGIKYSISQSQINWFIDTLKTCPNGYKIIISGHIPCTNSLKWSSDFTYCFYDIIEAYNNKVTLVKRDTVNNIDINADFSSCNGSVILYICGHGHVDDSYKSDTGCVYYEVYDDAYINNGGSQFTREIGTITEQSLDVVTINLDNNVMYMFRYGAGEDKMFNN